MNGIRRERCHEGCVCEVEKMASAHQAVRPCKTVDGKPKVCGW